MYRTQSRIPIRELRIDGSVVVPFGKYNWIDGFDNGLARVKTGGVTNGINKS